MERTARGIPCRHASFDAVAAGIARRGLRAAWDGWQLKRCFKFIVGKSGKICETVSGSRQSKVENDLRKSCEIKPKKHMNRAPDSPNKTY